MAADPNTSENMERVGRGFVSEDLYDETTLYVSKAGNNSNGLTWGSAFTTVTAAIAACTSTHMNTIRIGRGIFDLETSTEYVVLEKNIHIIGSGIGHTFIRNSTMSGHNLDAMFYVRHNAVHIEGITFDRDTDGGIAVWLTEASHNCIIENCEFLYDNATTNTSAAIVIQDSNRNIIRNCQIYGDGSETTGIYEGGEGHDNVFEKIRIKDCLNGIRITCVTNGDYNHHNDIIIDNCTTGLNLDAGDNNIFEDIMIRGCTTGIDMETGMTNTSFDELRIFGCTTCISDASTTSQYICIHSDDETGQIYPASLTGIAVTDGTGTGFGTDTEIIAAAAIDHPVRITGMSLETNVAEKHRIRFSFDSGSTFFYEMIKEIAGNTVKRHVINMDGMLIPPNARVSCSVASENGGSTLAVWLEIVII